MPKTDQELWDTNFKRRRGACMEAVESEKSYLTNVGENVIEGYLRRIEKGKPPLPEGLADSYRMIFGNVVEIYDWHIKVFQKEVEKGIEDPDGFAEMFLTHEDDFFIYVQFCANKTRSENYQAKYREYFREVGTEVPGTQLEFNGIIIVPVQRVTRYQLILNEVMIATTRMGLDPKAIMRARALMDLVPKSGNMMMATLLLQDFEGKKTTHGKLLLNELLQFQPHKGKLGKIDKSKFKEIRVFLFEQLLIFSKQVEIKRTKEEKKKIKEENKPDDPLFEYFFRHKLPVNMLELDDKTTEGTLMFILVDKSESSGLQYICKAPNIQMKRNWVAQIESILHHQDDFMSDICNPGKK